MVGSSALMENQERSNAIIFSLRQVTSSNRNIEWKVSYGKRNKTDPKLSICFNEIFHRIFEVGKVQSVWCGFCMKICVTMVTIHIANVLFIGNQNFWVKFLLMKNACKVRNVLLRVHAFMTLVSHRNVFHGFLLKYYIENYGGGWYERCYQLT